MTLSITVLVMEGTGALQLVVPMMLAVFVAKIVGDSVSMGVYDLHIKMRGAPVLVSYKTFLFDALQTIVGITAVSWACVAVTSI